MTGDFYKKLIDLDTDELRRVWDNNPKIKEKTAKKKSHLGSFK